MHNSQAYGLPCCAFCPFDNDPDLMHAVGEEGTIGSSQSQMRTTRYAYSEEMGSNWQSIIDEEIKWE